MDIQKVDEIVAGGLLPMADFAPPPLDFLTLSLAEKCIVLNGGVIDEFEKDAEGSNLGLTMA
jgi:hypothetical protein